MSLKEASARSMLWVNADRALSQPLNFIGKVILARLLLPADFGLVAMATIVTNLLNLVNELGLAEAIIQRQDLEEKHISTAFWINMASSGLLVLLIFLTAPAAAWFFENSELQPILRVLGLSFIIGSLTSVQRALFMRQMQFKIIAIGRTVRTFTRVAVTIALALTGAGVWSLVVGNLAGALAGTLLMWGLSSWRPKLILNRQGLAELLGFSLNLLGARIAGYFNNSIGEILIGKFLGTTALGIFTVASNSTSIFRTRVAASITEVTFPAFSSIHQDDERMRRGYQKVTRYISLMTFPALTGLAIVAPEFIGLVYGPKWAQVVLPMQILCIGAAFSTLGIINGPVQKAKGRTDHYLNLTIISLIVTILSTLIGVNYGLVGVAIALSIRSTLLLWGVNFFTHRLIGLPFNNYLKALYPAILCSVIMGGSMFFYHQYALQIFDHNQIAVLATSVLLGAGVFFLTLKIMNEESLNEGISIFWNIAGPSFSSIQKKLPDFRLLK